MKRLLPVLILLVILVNPTHAAVDIESKQLNLQAGFTDGYYMDYDGDGQQNDVIVEYCMTLSTDRSLSEALDHVRLFVFYALILPGHRHFVYRYNVDHLIDFLSADELASDEVHFDVRIIFEDHALQSGDYTAIMAFFMPGTHRQDHIDTIKFDPPGGADGPIPPPIVQRIVS